MNVTVAMSTVSDPSLSVNVTTCDIDSFVGEPVIVRFDEFQLIPAGSPVTDQFLFVPISAIVDAPSTFVMSTSAPGTNM